MAKRSCTKPAALGILLFLSLLPATGCGGGGNRSGGPSAASEHEEEIKAEERPFIDAAKPFYAAIAACEYDKAYAMLSTHARERMSLNQFKPEEDDAAFKKNEDNPVRNVAADKFITMLGLVEKTYGKPKRVENLHVYSTEADVLTRKSKEPTGAIDSLFAIGNMPDSIPGNIRKASLRGHVITELSAADIEKAAKEHGVSADELKKDPDFRPYFTLKVVLVEAGGELKVGYFEFLPPSMMD